MATERARARARANIHGKTWKKWGQDYKQNVETRVQEYEGQIDRLNKAKMIEDAAGHRLAALGAGEEANERVDSSALVAAAM